MPFTYHRTIHFADTDAAGVVFFANYLAIGHEAYEEALAAAGIDLARFFAGTGTMVPVARSEADYQRPLRTGDRVAVELTPKRLTEDSFEIRYTLTRLGPPAKRAGLLRTVHICIASSTRRRHALPPAIAAWVDAG
jgi:1,4-dihydroxy-2-naphthoyl-CoA hydrolase